MEQKTETGLIRGIRRWDFVALMINCVIGAGIYGLPSKIYGLTGVWSVLACLVCAILAALIMFCFAEVGSRFAETGGPYLYARAAFGSFIGFEVGWLLWLGRVTGFAALCNLQLAYISFFWPAAGSGWTRAVVITVVVIAITIVNVIGVREAALVNNIFTIGKLAPLLLFVVVGLFFINPEPFTELPTPELGAFSRAVLLMVFAFSGFEMAVIPAGEISDPRRHIAFALLTALGVAALLYLSIQVVCIGTLPELANSERPLADAGSRFLGASGASIFLVSALISVSGTLTTTMLGGPRILFGMAERGQLPRILAATHRRFHTPHIAIVISAVVMLVLTLQGTFISAVTITTVIRLLVYIATCISLPVLRFKKDSPSPRFRAPAGVALAVGATALSVWLLSNSAANDARAAGLAAALGLLIFFIRGKREKADPHRPLIQAQTDK
jgi:basic amino acid/polyamine antiporter, APA family